MEQINQYITPIVAVGVFIIIEILKRSFTFDKRYIPLLSAILGYVFVQWNSGLNFSFEIFIQGIVSGGSSVWLYELFDNLNKPKTKDLTVDEYPIDDEELQ